MSVKVTIRWHGDQLLKKVESEMSRRVKRAAAEVQRTVIKNVSQHSARDEGHSPPGSFPYMYKGDFKRSVFAWERDKFYSEIGVPKQSPAQKYARGLEFGNTINAKDKLMTIPFSKKAKAHARKGGTAPEFPIPLLKISRAGRRPVLAEIKGSGKRKRVIIHYVLASSVRIEQRPFLAPSLEQTKPRIIEIFSEPMSL